METLRPRNQMDKKYCWRLEDIFANDQLWEDSFGETRERIGRLEALSGTLGRSAKALKAALDELSQTIFQTEKLATYARMRQDEDNANGHYQALSDRANSLYVELGTHSAFFEPELLEIDQAVLDEYMGQADLAEYAYYVGTVTRRRQHTLDARGEQLLALAGDVTGAPRNIFSMFDNADLKFPEIKDEDGQSVAITHGRFIPLLESPDRDVRRNAYEGLYSTYRKYENTLAASFSSSVKADIFYARARSFPSALEASLHPDAVPTQVYDALIGAVRANFPAQHRYTRLRRKALGVEKLHLYDIYTPLTGEATVKYNYDQAKEIVARGLAPLGGDYLKTMNEGLDTGGWVDVYENQNKTSGAYSWGIWGTHPYVLLNWSDTLDNTFTLAHELGHAMHSYLADSNQNFFNSQYPLILAEVASTTNEILLADYLLEQLTGKQEKMYLINHMIEQIRTTVIRQTMFAEFEQKTHAMAEAGEALTPQSLCAVYKQLVEDYFGPDVVVDDYIAMEWARIPHFYNAFYVYKYAVGYSSALAFAKMVKTGEAGKERYLDFLRAGGSDYPLTLLDKAGVNLLKPDAVNDCLAYFAQLVDRMEALLEQ